MFHSQTKRLALALAVACCTLAAFASLAAEQASASTGCTGAAGFNFELGVTNSCNYYTYLNGSAGLSVTWSSPSWYRR